MKVVWEESPGKAGRGGLLQDDSETGNKRFSVCIIEEDLSPIQASADDVVEGSRSIDACLPWHALKLPHLAQVAIKGIPYLERRTFSAVSSLARLRA